MVARATYPVSLDSNENPFGPSSHAVEAMVAEASNSARYSEDVSELLRAQIAQREGVEPGQIIFGLGGGQALEMFALYLSDTVGLADGGEVVSCTPTYLRFIESVERHGGVSVAVPANAALEHDLEAMEAVVGPRTRCVYICNPNNPTGTVVDPAALRSLVGRLTKTCAVLLDEAYLECSEEYQQRSLMDLLRGDSGMHNLVIMKTFSKIYGLAGQRVGYIVAPQTMAPQLSAYVPWTAGLLNRLGVVAASASLSHQGYVEHTRAQIRAARDSLCSLLDELGLRWARSHANFVFFQTHLPHADFKAAMAAHGVMAARAFPPYETWSRLSLGLPAEMAVAHAALRAIYKDGPQPDPSTLEQKREEKARSEVNFKGPAKAKL